MADTVTPRGYAATAAEFLDASAEDAASTGDMAVRQLAATQAIGYALLALGDQLADLTDAVADVHGELGGLAAISDAVAGIAGSLEEPGRFKAAFVALRAYWGTR